MNSFPNYFTTVGKQLPMKYITSKVFGGLLGRWWTDLSSKLGIFLLCMLQGLSSFWGLGNQITKLLYFFKKIRILKVMQLVLYFIFVIQPKALFCVMTSGEKADTSGELEKTNSGWWAGL